MENKKQKDNEEVIQIQIKKKEHKKLIDYKIHPNQPYWEVIKMLIDEKEKRENDATRR